MNDSVAIAVNSVDICVHLLPSQYSGLVVIVLNLNIPTDGVPGRCADVPRGNNIESVDPTTNLAPVTGVAVPINTVSVPPSVTNKLASVSPSIRTSTSAPASLIVTLPSNVVAPSTSNVPLV